MKNDGKPQIITRKLLEAIKSNEKFWMSLINEKETMETV